MEALGEDGGATSCVIRSSADTGVTLPPDSAPAGRIRESPACDRTVLFDGNVTSSRRLRPARAGTQSPPYRGLRYGGKTTTESDPHAGLRRARGGGAGARRTRCTRS